MGGQKFQYDESGGKFFYFLLSFLALILVPSTYYLWPRSTKPDVNQQAKECQCDGCKKKKIILYQNDSWKETRIFLRKLIILLGWGVFILLAYKVSELDYELTVFDPYDILGIPPDSSQAAIKRAYRKLSLILHPDKETGNEVAFMKLTKAYQALTVEEAQKNWEKYGNPDGPGVMSFGIALPSWIVEKENSVWVLGLYALVFMVALPTVVGMWWYKSIRYTDDQVLLATTQFYYNYILKTPNMVIKRILMIIGGSFEFNKKYNAEIEERITDWKEVALLIKQLNNVSAKNREKPICFFYSVKARAILHAHLSRIPLNPATLEKDRQYIVKKCPYLIQEMIMCVNQLIIMAYSGRVAELPSINTIENCMKLSPMIVQGYWESKSPLLQLPHITEDKLKHFLAKKRQIRTLQQLAQLKNEDRRQILRSLSDEQYEDVMKVLGSMPYIDFEVKAEVMDDEKPNEYTAGAIVTVTVSLTRKDMSHLFGDDTVQEQTIEEDREEESKVTEAEAEEAAKVKKPAWMKQKRGHKKTNKKNTNKKNNKVVVAGAASGTTDTKTAADKTVPNGPQADKVANSVNAKKKDDKGSIEESKKKSADSNGSESDVESERSGDEEESSVEKMDSAAEEEDDDLEWESRCQKRLLKREKVLEGRSNVSHEVHCPMFPDVKQEYWWVYVCDRKSRTLLTTPAHITSLSSYEEVELRFSAPRWPGVYTFTVCLRSDSYFGFHQSKDIKMDVKEAPEVPLDHPQWEISDEESAEEIDDIGEHSEYTTDEDVSDNE